MNNIKNGLKAGLLLGAALFPSAALSFSDQAEAAADQIDAVAGLSREFARNLTPEMYGLCANGHVFALALWAREGMPDDLQMMWELIGRGLVDYRAAAANEAFLDSMFTAQSSRWDMDIAAGAKRCTDLLVAPLN